MNELLVVLQNVDRIFNVIFVATLAGLSIMAAALLCPVCERIREPISKLEEWKRSSLTDEIRTAIQEKLDGQEKITFCKGMWKIFVNTFYLFIIALFLIFVLDTYGELYNDILIFEVVDIILSGTPLSIGLLYLMKGAKGLKDILISTEL